MSEYFNIDEKNLDQCCEALFQIHNELADSLFDFLPKEYIEKLAEERRRLQKRILEQVSEKNAQDRGADESENKNDYSSGSEASTDDMSETGLIRRVMREHGFGYNAFSDHFFRIADDEHV